VTCLKCKSFLDRFGALARFCVLNVPVVCDVILLDVRSEKPVVIEMDNDCDAVNGKEMVRFQVCVMRDCGLSACAYRGFVCCDCLVPLNDPSNCKSSENNSEGICFECFSARVDFAQQVVDLHYKENLLSNATCACIEGKRDKCHRPHLVCWSCQRDNVTVADFIKSRQNRTRSRCAKCWLKICGAVYLEGSMSICDLFKVVDIADKVIDFARSWMNMMLVCRRFCDLVTYHVDRGLICRHYFVDAIKPIECEMSESNDENYHSDGISHDRCVVQLLQIPRLFFDVFVDIGFIDMGPCLYETWKLKPIMFSRYHPARFEMWCPYFNDYTPEEVLPIVTLIDWHESKNYKSNSMVFYCFMQPHFREYYVKDKQVDDFDYAIDVAINFSHFRIYSPEEVRDANRWSFSHRFWEYYKSDYDLPIGKFRELSHQIVKQRSKETKKLHQNPVYLRMSE